MLQVSKNLLEVWLYTINVHSDSPQGTKFWCQQICLVTSFICCKFKKKTSLKSDFIQFFFSWLNTCTCVAPAQGQRDPRALNFGVIKKGLITFVCLCWGLTSQSTIFQSYRDGGTASWVINQYFRGGKVSCSRTQHGGGRFRTPDLSLRSPTLYHWATALPVITFLICCKFQRNLFEVWFYTIVFMI